MKHFRDHLPNRLLIIRANSAEYHGNVVSPKEIIIRGIRGGGSIGVSTCWTYAEHIHSFISTYLYRMTISVIVVTAINMGPVFTTQRTATIPGTSRPTLFE